MKKFTRIKRKFGEIVEQELPVSSSVDIAASAYLRALRDKVKKAQVNANKSEILETLNMPIKNPLRAPKKIARAAAIIRNEILTKGSLQGKILARQAREMSTEEILEVALTGEKPQKSANFYLVTFGKELNKVLSDFSEGYMKLLKSKKIETYTYFFFDDNSKKSIENFLSSKIGIQVAMDFKLGETAQTQNKMQELQNGGIL